MKEKTSALPRLFVFPLLQPLDARLILSYRNFYEQKIYFFRFYF